MLSWTDSAVKRPVAGESERENDTESALDFMTPLCTIKLTVIRHSNL